MIPLTLAEVTTMVGGELHFGSGNDPAQTVVNGVVDTDSREIVPGGIFFAKPGEVTDGHRFIPDAVANGAELIVAEHVVDVSVPLIVVPDVVTALGDLAAAIVKRVKSEGDLTIVGITGSNGKTTTKNLVKTILERVGPTIAPRGSFNNEVGAPLTMTKIEENTRFLVAEMGASRRGDIARLVRMAKPDIAAVLCVGLAHAGEFGGIDATVEAKSEIVTELEPTGVAVLNRDDPRVVSMRDKTHARVVWFGLHDDADVRASDITSDARGTTFLLHLSDEEARRVRFRVLGEHHVMNALAAAAVTHESGVPADTIVDALESVELAEQGRMQVLGGGERNITVINDAYNASPDSMSAALKTLAQITGPDRRSIAILGAMSELGDLAGPEHDRLGLQAVRLGINQLVAVGPDARRIHVTAVNEGSWDGESVYCETVDDAYQLMSDTARDGDTILVKSSNSAGLRFLGDRLGALFS